MSDVLDRYNERISEGLIERDAAQAEIAGLLDDLAYRIENRGKKGWFSKPKKVEGLYLWGGVGRGKSMLMDLFFSAVQVEHKRRVHFHDFMQEAHSFITEWKKLSPAERKSTGWAVKGGVDDPIPPAARKIAASAELLCFDEFQVKDIADATLLGRLFEHLLDLNVVVVATSNRPPDDLYKNGLNRQRFLPFIALLKDTHHVHEIRSDRDYRLERLTAAPVYYSPLGSDADTCIQEAWDRLTSNAEPHETHLTVHGRQWLIPAQAAGVARMSFDELCDRPLGAADYLSLARHFDTVLIEHVPVLGPENRNAALRFVTLIDALYEARAKVIISAEAEPNALYVSGDGAFEFERTASRLYEMRSADYLAAERIVDEDENAT
ncbi:cell division protein ZapE [Ponticaulis sp.]|uniref:cell division protein ZapE n=1 Tax=Ponticaulis sp. TaxID=2020902 RepID=UPI000B6EB5A7|nr:cell division protein ZapE [Ponticaulis sp.]MAI90703.1 cell division protein ZapE [Ponticaulis sp.]OUX99208.1 MAG: cell division protein ZapE [Hyphomonadaceae bacterium TMED5]|tara:strand:- start:7785 stop:8921 length:1137 start_codon:yes stop_codon:yes gene_type:complete